jgi:hypothetical protein
MSGDVYLKAPDTMLFKAFCKEMSGCFNIQNLEFRQSDHYANGEYAKGLALGVTIWLAYADDPDFLDYKFSLSFSFVPRDALGGDQFLDAVADHVSRRLTLLGWNVARDADMGKVGGRKILYFFDGACDITTNIINGA